MKSITRWIFTFVAAALSAQTALAAYPDKPVTMIIGYPPGQATDIVGRLLADKLSQRLGQPFVVENKPGQGASLALAQLTKEKPDGYTMVLSATAAYVTNPHLYKSVGYDTLKDFQPIGTGCASKCAFQRLPGLSRICQGASGGADTYFLG
jgi:tripartite-type tricarboxylate transporter receptor subunit TctC